MDRKSRRKTWCCLLAWLAPAWSAPAQAQVTTPSFFARTDLNGPGNQSVAVADFNGDGIQDIMMSGYGSPVWLGNGDGTFRGPVTTAHIGESINGSSALPSASSAITGSTALAVGDLNGDGKIDMAVPGNTGALVFWGNGDGTFQPTPVNFPTSYGPIFIAIADVNADNRPDIVVATATGVSILLNQGGGSFTLSNTYLQGQPGVSVVAGDLNGDGIPDLAVGTKNAVTLLLGAGNGTFTPGPTLATPFYPGSIFIADLNGDGVEDVIASGSSRTQGVTAVYTFFGIGRGGFSAAKTVPFPAGVTQIAVGDVNGDGFPDLAVLQNNPDAVGVLTNKRNGTFNPPASYSAVYAATYLVLAPLRKPGLLDIVVSGMLNNASVLLNAGNGTFLDGLRIKLPAQPGPLAAADFNRDGLTDLAVTTATGVAIFLNTHIWYFPLYPVQNIVLAAPPTQTVVGDFNGDGIPDLAIALSDSEIAVVFGNGRGTFSAPVYTAPSGVSNGWPIQISAADLNGDGKADLATTYNTILIGNGDGTFQAGFPILPQATVDSYLGISMIAAADLNGDGKMDLVVILNPFGAVIYSLINSGSAQFAVANTSNGAAVATQVAVADINGDGIPDLVLTFSNSAPGYLLGAGGGVFPQQTTLLPTPTGWIPLNNDASLVVADLNGDGIPDVAVTTTVGSCIELFTGTGGGNFEFPVLLGTAPNSTYLVTGHFYPRKGNRPDLVVSALDGVDILLNTTP